MKKNQNSENGRISNISNINDFTSSSSRESLGNESLNSKKILEESNNL